MVSYTTQGVCASRIDIEMDGDIIKNIKFIGGCNGNTQGVAKLAAGRKAQEVIDILKGTRCGFKSTSCPDQLARALEGILEGRQ